MEGQALQAARALGAPVGVQRIAVVINKRWNVPASGTLTLGVRFLDTANADLKAKILAHMNAWYDRGVAVKFVESVQNAAVRIARTAGGGYWSYLGTDILAIPATQPTMNLDSFTLSTPDREYARVVRHEVGHTLGCPHEHMRAALVGKLDRAKTIAYFQQTQGWSAQETQQQVLTPLNEQSLMGTPVDADSVMTYQLPGQITISGLPIKGGLDINDSDAAFMSSVYPKPGTPPTPPPAAATKLTIDPAAKKVTLPPDWTVG
jgi:hypothetical protein